MTLILPMIGSGYIAAGGGSLPNGTILSSFASPSTNPRGLTYAGGNLISCDANADLIYIHDGVSSTILSSFASPSSTPSGLAYTGTNLISCDYTSDLIYTHDNS